MSTKKESSTFRVVRVLLTEDYLVPMYSDGVHTKLDGRTLDDVVTEWFSTHDANAHHASREGHRIGGGRKFISTQVIEESQLAQERKQR